eukprot:3784788-Pleurochrysis_carterae.AAC.3
MGCRMSSQGAFTHRGIVHFCGLARWMYKRTSDLHMADNRSTSQYRYGLNCPISAYKYSRSMEEAT